MKTFNMYYCGKDLTVKIAEVTDVEGLENKQIVAYRTEKEQMEHHKTIKGGVLFYSSFHRANHFIDVLFKMGYRCSSTFIKA